MANLCEVGEEIFGDATLMITAPFIKEVIIAVVKVGKCKDIYKGELPRSASDYKITERSKVKDLKKKVGKE